jgi:hypothetical protein
MIKIVVKVKNPEINYISPYKLSDAYTSQEKNIRITAINDNFVNILRWANAKRNYTS